MIHFIDTETTGLDAVRHEIIEIAIITEYGDGEIRRWHTKIKPVSIETADPIALEVNGYSEEDWEFAPTFKDVYLTIQDKLREGVIVGHNVSFDMEFIREAMKCVGADHKDVSRIKIDTITLAHEHLTPMGLRSLSMDSIRGFLNWNKQGSHSALKDTEDCRKLYWCLLRRQTYNQVIEKKDLTAPDNALERLKACLELLENKKLDRTVPLPQGWRWYLENFLPGMIEKAEKYGDRMIWSEKQKKKLSEIEEALHIT